MNVYQSIKKACKINDKIFKEIVRNFDQFETEKDIEKYILKRFKDSGVGKAYDPICANNYSVIHAKPRNVKLKRGFLCLDFGARVNGQCSDMTRTIYLGKAPTRHKEIYDLLLKTQKACVKKAKIGANCGELYDLSRYLLGRYKKYYLHSLGHGVGYRIHQLPRLRHNSKDILKRGDFFTIEPGIYIKNKREEFGLRIEDTLYVGRKTKVLSRSSKRLIEINYSLK